MTKPRHEFFEAVTKRAAREYIAARDSHTMEVGTIPQDYLWDALHQNRWPVERMVLESEGLVLFQSLGQTMLTRVAVHDVAVSLLEDLRR